MTQINYVELFTVIYFKNDKLSIVEIYTIGRFIYLLFVWHLFIWKIIFLSRLCRLIFFKFWQLLWYEKYSNMKSSVTFHDGLLALWIIHVNWQHDYLSHTSVPFSTIFSNSCIRYTIKRHHFSNKSEWKRLTKKYCSKV